jgi:hypothetical protein
LTFSASDEGTDRVTLNLDLSARGAPDAIVDIAIAFAPTNQPLGAYYEPILSGLNALGNYSATIAGLDSGTTYACRLRVRNNLGGEIFVDGTFAATTGAGSIIGNGGFEEGSSIASGNVGDLYDNNGVWPATTTVWKVNADKSVYNNGLSKPYTFFTPNATFTLGRYSAFIWKEGSFEQDIVVPRTGRYRLGFRYGLASNYNPGINISAEITQNDATTVIWSANNVTAKTTQLVPEETFVNLVRGPATFTIRQTINSTASTAGCYDDITLIAQDSEWVNELVVASQNPAVTGGMIPAERTRIPGAPGTGTPRRRAMKHLHGTAGTGRTAGTPCGIRAREGRSGRQKSSGPSMSVSATGRRPQNGWRPRSWPAAGRPRRSAAAWTGSWRSPTAGGRITGLFCAGLPSCVN